MASTPKQFWFKFPESKVIGGLRNFKYTELEGHSNNGAPIYHNPGAGAPWSSSGNEKGNYVYKASDGKWICAPFYSSYDGWNGPAEGWEAFSGGYNLPDIQITEGQQVRGVMCDVIVSKEPADTPTKVETWIIAYNGGLSGCRWAADTRVSCSERLADEGVPSQVAALCEELHITSLDEVSGCFYLTALMRCSAEGNTAKVKELLDAGANPSLLDCRNQDALAMSANQEIQQLISKALNDK
eukprot:TRINITY_DN19598_c0_g1_i1.p1 TRINITY_DN19598_c0_g1~~TRINITY_DN19598_c0_g1_i1.p1  ORF type:complete len:241 (-),score=52.51 TRINITY_DN19598_c0_g1_i1:171-893(-)